MEKILKLLKAAKEVAESSYMKGPFVGTGWMGKANVVGPFAGMGRVDEGGFSRAAHLAMALRMDALAS